MSDIDFVNKTNTQQSEKDLWQTPKELFNALDKEFNFDTDICASDKNALCSTYFTEEHSAFDARWDFFYRSASCFVNPPYSQTQKFLLMASEQAKEYGVTVVALVNANTDTKWFAEASKTASEVRLISGRISFVKPDGKKASGNPKGQALIIWRGTCKTPCVISVVDRDELIGK
jgi:phage N-6-adenine-methyltransferase